MPSKTRDPKPASDTEIIAAQRSQIEQLEESVAELVLALDAARSDLTRLRDQVGAGSSGSELLQIGSPVYPDHPVTQFLHRCEIRCSPRESARLESLRLHCIAHGYRYLDGRGDERIVDLHNHALLWLIQAIKFDGDKQSEKGDRS